MRINATNAALLVFCLLGLSSMVMAQEPASEFTFPADLGGTLLQKTLKPRVPLTAIAERTTHPRPKPTPASIENPTGFPAAGTEIVRLAPLQPRGFPAPRIALVERPLGDPATPALPAPVVLTVGARTRMQRPDAGAAPELPFLAAFVPDRASLEDPTRDMSLEAVLIAPIPVRQNPLAFTRQAIPDPFENRRTVRFTHPEEEPSQPLSGQPRVP